MAQFRLTRKFAADCKVKPLAAPQQRLELLDDWIIDVMELEGGKVAIVSHVKTCFTLLIPYAHVGGAKGVPGAVSSALLAQLDYNKACFPHIPPMDTVLSPPFYFCSTQNQKVLGHMSDFKVRVALMAEDIPFHQINWVALMQIPNTTLIDFQPIERMHPIRMLGELLLLSYTGDAH